MYEDEDDYEYFCYDLSETEQLPPLIKTKSRIIFCVVNNDLEGLKLLINYSKLFEIVDSRGYSNLQIAILMNNVAVFDLLLSLDGCPIENRDKEGKTALEVALTSNIQTDEHFAYSLLKKGANIDYNRQGTLLLHCAMTRNYCKVVRFLIENGADLNCQNKSGQTPIHLIRRVSDMDEILAMLLCFGADPSIPDYDDYRLIDFAFQDEYFSEPMQENLLFYLFDDYYTRYDIAFDVLFGLLESESPFVPYLLNQITSVNVDENRIYGGLESFFIKLFIIEPEYLNLLLQKFDYVIKNVLDASLRHGFKCFVFPQGMFIENFDLLLQSRFSSDVIQIINKTEICNLITLAQQSKIPQSVLFESLMVMLNYGANIYDKDVEDVYKICGDCEFFRILLHMDIKISDENQQRDIMPGLIYNIHIDIDIFLNDPHNYSLKALAQLLNYFACPKLKRFCCSLPIQNENIRDKVLDLPSVPFLVELARNELRKFLIRKYKIENCMQFYTLIKHLPISKIHEKIITLETKLY